MNITNPNWDGGVQIRKENIWWKRNGEYQIVFSILLRQSVLEMKRQSSWYSLTLFKISLKVGKNA